MIGHFKSPLGWIEYETSDGCLVRLSFVEEPSKKQILNDAVFDSLNGYFLGYKKSFELDVKFEKGTDFQKQVWMELLKIPYGQTKSYLDIAKLIGNPKAVRAVGQACKKNSIGIVVPCHRVIGQDQTMKGYSGKDYIHLKISLLQHENAIIKPR